MRLGAYGAKDCSAETGDPRSDALFGLDEHRTNVPLRAMRIKNSQVDRRAVPAKFIVYGRYIVGQANFPLSKLPHKKLLQLVALAVVPVSTWYVEG